MYVGLDISKSEIVCIGKDREGAVLYEGKFRVSANDIDKLVDIVGRDSIFAVEPSTTGVFVYDYLVSKKMQVKAANPNRIRLIADSEKKTDREDACILADLLRTNMLPTSYLPAKDIREVRDIIRHRKSMVEIRTTIKNKISSVLSREAIEINYTDILGVRSLRKLSEMKLNSEVQQDALGRLVHIAGALSSEISDYDSKILENYRISRNAQLLDSIPGVSYYSAVHIMSAIGDINRFPSDEELASYAGLTPKIFQSGNTRIDKGLRHGDSLLKWVLVQDANAAVKLRGKLRRYYLKKKRRKGHQKAIVATARKMVEIIYIMLTRGETYRE